MLENPAALNSSLVSLTSTVVNEEFKTGDSEVSFIAVVAISNRSTRSFFFPDTFKPAFQKKKKKKIFKNSQQTSTSRLKMRSKYSENMRN